MGCNPTICACDCEFEVLQFSEGRHGLKNETRNGIVLCVFEQVSNELVFYDITEAIRCPREENDLCGVKFRKSVKTIHMYKIQGTQEISCSTKNLWRYVTGHNVYIHMSSDGK